MVQGALLRRSSQRAALCVAALSMIALTCAALGLLAPTAARAQAPYPPTPPCALSWEASDGQAILIGSGLGVRQNVAVTLYPESSTLASFVTDSTGAFEGPVVVPPDAGVSWLTARTIGRSCSTTTPTPPGSGSSGVVSTPPGSGTSSSTAASPTSGTTGSRTPSPGSSAGVQPGGTAGTTAVYPPSDGATGSNTGSSSSARSSGAGSPTAPSSSGAAGPSTPAPTPSPTDTKYADRSPAKALGLPTSLIVTIAALLLLAGGLAVLFLTRRSS